MQGYLDGIQAAVPRILEEPSTNVVMDGSMSTFALYWAGSGVLGAPSFFQGGCGLPRQTPQLLVHRQCLSKRLACDPLPTHLHTHYPPHYQARPTARSHLPPFPAGNAATPSSKAAPALATSSACRTDACRRAGKLSRRWGVGCGQHSTQCQPPPQNTCRQNVCLGAAPSARFCGTHRDDLYHALAASSFTLLGSMCLLQAAVQAGLPYTDVQLPMLMRALYGSRIPKFVLLLRNPVDRIYSAYFGWVPCIGGRGLVGGGAIQVVSHVRARSSQDPSDEGAVRQRHRWLHQVCCGAGALSREGYLSSPCCL